MKTTLIIPEKVPSNNGEKGLLRMHYRERTKLCSKYQWLFKEQTKNRHLGRVTISITHYYRGSPIKDYDNLVSTIKIPFDAIKKAGIIVDDHQLITGIPTFTQIRVKKKEQVKTVIEIEDLNQKQDAKTQIYPPL